MSIDTLVDRAGLTPVVRRALGSRTADVVEWTVAPVATAFSELTNGPYRVEGTAADGGRVVQWSLILKVCNDPRGAEGDAPRSWEYPKRELLAYASGTLDGLAPGLRVPRCYGADERPEGGAWLWLEPLSDAYGHAWPLARYGLAARHAGRFNGEYLGGRPVPAVPWLCVGLARSYVERFGPPIERMAELAEHPLARCQWPDPRTRDRLVGLWLERETFLGSLARLPQTLAHLDFSDKNLFAVRSPDGVDETVAVDWAFLGTAAVGEELAPLVCASSFIGYAPADRVRELGEAAFEGYLAGLRDAGWRGDARLARLGYAAGVIRYGLGALGLVAAIDPDFGARLSRAWGPLEALLERLGLVHLYTLDLADEARVLTAQLL